MYLQDTLFNSSYIGILNRYRIFTLVCDLWKGCSYDIYEHSKQFANLSHVE